MFRASPVTHLSEDPCQIPSPQASTGESGEQSGVTAARSRSAPVHWLRQKSAATQLTSLKSNSLLVNDYSSIKLPITKLHLLSFLSQSQPFYRINILFCAVHVNNDKACFVSGQNICSSVTSSVASYVIGKPSRRLKICSRVVVNCRMCMVQSGGKNLLVIYSTFRQRSGGKCLLRCIFKSSL